MFSYYGSKSKIVDYYPPPKHKRIIEPFAGSARYSLKYWQNDVLLVDKYPVIVEVWNYLKNASEADILKLPRLERGEKFKDHKLLSDVEKKFFGFITQAGSTGERYSVGTMQGVNVDADLKKIAAQLYKIRHWEIKLGSYDELENVEANELERWFNDRRKEMTGTCAHCGGRSCKDSDQSYNCNVERSY